MARKVFLSHTSELRENPKERSFYEAAQEAVIELEYAPIAQPYFTAEQTPSAAACTREIEKADYVVFIIGFQWGSPVRDKQEVSYTEFEYGETVRLGKPRFVFLISEETSDLTPQAAIDRENGERQAAFRERLPEDDQVVKTIESAEELQRAVYKAIRRWEDIHGGAIPPAPDAAEVLPPFDDIALLLKNGGVIPLLGPEAGLPPDYDPPATEPPPPRDELLTRFADRVPSDLELSLFLADYSQYPPGQRLALPDVASFYSVTRGHTLVQQRLREAYVGDRMPRAIHRHLASLDPHLLIVVTGFDDLMEQALRDAERPFKTIIQPATKHAGRVLVIAHDDPEPRPQLPEEVDIDLERESIVYKPYGSFVRARDDWDQYVVTEDSNIAVLGGLAGNAIPNQMYESILSKRFLFLGLGLELWTTRSLLSRIKADRSGEVLFDRVNEKPAWAVHSSPSALESKLWAALNTEVFDMDLDRFAEGLESAR